MKYAIMSIDESRSAKKTAIRNTISAWKEIKFPCVNGHNREELKKFQLLLRELDREENLRLGDFCQKELVCRRLALQLFNII